MVSICELVIGIAKYSCGLLLTFITEGNDDFPIEVIEKKDVIFVLSPEFMSQGFSAV